MILALFCFGLAFDVLWTWMVQAVTSHTPIRAGLYAALLNAAATGSTWYIVDAKSFLGLLAFSLGGGIGTALACRKKKLKHDVFNGLIDLISKTKGKS
jgi:hypothetical protein